MNWVQVRHRYPEKDKDVLVFDGQDQWVAIYVVEEPSRGYPQGRSWWSFKTANDNCCFCVCPDLKTVTHWAHLPEDPK